MVCGAGRRAHFLLWHSSQSLQSGGACMRIMLMTKLRGQWDECSRPCVPGAIDSIAWYGVSLPFVAAHPLAPFGRAAASALAFVNPSL